MYRLYYIYGFVLLSDVIFIESFHSILSESFYFHFKRHGFVKYLKSANWLLQNDIETMSDNVGKFDRCSSLHVSFNDNYNDTSDVEFVDILQITFCVTVCRHDHDVNQIAIFTDFVIHLLGLI